MLGKKRQCFIPQRQVNWKKYAYLHNRENNIFYDCECGKRYVSFPAIYLHFQRKHNKKLATKFDPKQCEIRKTERQVTYFYYSSMKRHCLGKQFQKDSNNTQTKYIAFLQSIFTEFLKEEIQTKEKLSFNESNRILIKLEKFVLQMENSKPQSVFSQTDILYELPLYFNDFVEMENNLNHGQTSEQYAQICLILFKLAKWLKTKDLTDLIVQFNAEQNLQKA